MKPIRVTFHSRAEIRMGSPYTTCKVRLRGEWVPELPNGGEDFQAVKAWSDDNQLLALVQWNIKYPNQPGFKIIVISIPERRIFISRRRSGCCRALEWGEGRFHYLAFAEVSGSVAMPRRH